MDKKIKGSGICLTQGGEDFIILENGCDIGYLKVPPQNIISNPINFKDDSGNIYKISIKTTLTEIYYDIELLTLRNQKGFKSFKNNLSFTIDDSALNFDVYEFLTTEEFITGHMKRIEWSSELINKQLFEISIIINVSILETLVRNVFKDSLDNLYFKHIQDHELDREILKFLKKYELLDGYLNKLLHININSSIVKLINFLNKFKFLNLKEKYIEILLSKINLSRNQKINAFTYLVKNLNKDVINFQQFNGDKSYASLLKNLFNIDVQKYIQSEKIEKKCIRDILIDMYQIRHKLIHGIEVYTVDEDKAKIFFEATEKLSNFIFDASNRMNNRY